MIVLYFKSKTGISAAIPQKLTDLDDFWQLSVVARNKLLLFNFSVIRIWFLTSLVVSTDASDCLEGRESEVIYNVMTGTSKY